MRYGWENRRVGMWVIGQCHIIYQPDLGEGAEDKSFEYAIPSAKKSLDVSTATAKPTNTNGRGG
jgi:hypothetical protein